MNPRHRKIIGLYWSTHSTSSVAAICDCTQDRVRRVWNAAIARGEIITPSVRPRDGWPWELVGLVSATKAPVFRGAAA